MTTRRPARTTLVATVLVGALALTAACSSDRVAGTTARATSGPRQSSTTGPATTTTTTAATTVAPATSAATATAALASGFPADWRPAPLTWRRCDVADRTECATLRVPLDWSAPGGAQIDLALGRQRATGRRIGSLLSNPGGPGGSGLELLTYDAFSPELARRFDLVSWDPRGVGQSTRARCGGTVAPFLANDPDPDTPAESAAIEAAAATVALTCAKETGPLLAHLGTDDVARDLEAIRRALGDEPLNYLGFSYGTQIGQRYAQFFPDRIRTMVLDGVVDTSLGYTEFLLGQTDAFDRAFQRAAGECRDAGAKECGVGDLAAAYDRVRARVELSPLPAGRRTVGPAELATAATYVAYLDGGWADLGPALAAAEKGRGGPLLDLADAYYDNEGYPTYAGVTCTDTPPPRGAEAYRRFTAEALRRSARFGGSVANELLPCAFWPVAPAAPPAALRAPGVPPVVVVGNTGDPATPYANAVTVAKALPGAVLVTADIGGHTAYGSNACVGRHVDRYLVDRTLPPVGSRCR